MTKKLSILAVSLLFCAAAMAQEITGGIVGKVLCRTDRSPVESAKIELFKGTSSLGVTSSAEDGSFSFEAVPDGMYDLVITEPDYLQTTVNVTVNDGYVKNVFNLSLTPVNTVAEVDDATFGEHDLDDSGYQDNPTILFSSNDVFNSMAGYNFSSVRFRARGYSSESQEVYLAGVKMNEAVTGYSPYSLWSGLNEVTRSKDSSTGCEPMRFALGGYNGVTNIKGQAGDVRNGLRGSVLTNSSIYRLRLMLTYGSGFNDKGWAWAVSASARLGGNDWVNGVYYRSFGYYFGVDKKFGDVHKIGAVFMAAPGERGAQNGSTQEVYDLMGDNMYNSNWGYQNGKVRNARVKKTHEPVTFIKYDFTPSTDFQASATLLYRFGKNGYTALDWYDSYDPRPDYYRNLPSYFYSENADLQRSDRQMYYWTREAWMTDYAPVTHVNWDYLYNVNYNARDGRSKFVQEERRTDQKDLNFGANFRWQAAREAVITGGVNFKWNRTEYFKTVADLLGGSYYLNINNFAERDYASDQAKIQNDLDYWLEHGEARKVGLGGKYGYDYNAHVHDSKLWLNAEINSGNFQFTQGYAIGTRKFWREGLMRNGLFAGTEDEIASINMKYGTKLVYNGQTSLGNSETRTFTTMTVKSSANYVLKGGHRIYGNLGYVEAAPNFNQAFLSPRTRNTIMDGLTTSKTFTADLNYQFSASGYNLRVTGYYTTIKDQTDLMSFYDDVQNSFTNFALTGINERHVGLEMGFKVPTPVQNIFLQGVLSWGKYVYTSNPRMTQTVDNSAETVIDDQLLPYWKSHPVFARDDTGEYLTDSNGDWVIDHFQEHYVPSTPQLAASIGLAYNRNYWFIDADVDYFSHSYLDMNPLYRTDTATSGADRTPTPAEVEYMAAQEMFKPALLLNFSIGKSWYIHNRQLGFSLQLKNLLNNKDVKTGGYEQTRIVDNTKAGERYYRFDSRYFYMSGMNYMLNIYFRF